METSIQALKANQSQVQPTPTPTPTPAPTLPQQVQAVPTLPQVQVQPVQQSVQMAPISPMQQMYNNTLPMNEYPMTLGMSYSKMKDSGVLLLIAMIYFSTPMQDTLVKSIPFFASTYTGKHTNMMGCLLLAGLVTSSYTFYKTFGNE